MASRRPYAWCLECAKLITVSQDDEVPGIYAGYCDECATQSLYVDEELMWQAGEVSEAPVKKEE